jgi:hypothetical protein
MLDKFYVAIGVDGLDLELMNNAKGINFRGNKSGKYASRAEAEQWAQKQVANGQRMTYVIFEAISSVCPKEQPFITEELRTTALPPYVKTGNGQTEEHVDF